MKMAKKLTAVLLAISVIFAMSLTTFAADEPTTYSLTIENTTVGHTYSVYQILTGDVDKENNKLSNVKYGENYNGKTPGNPATNEDIAAFVNNAAKAKAVAGGTPKIVESTEDNTVITGLVPGYYYVVETGTIPEGEAATAYIVQVVGDASVDVKAEAPTVEKKVKDTNDTTGEVTDWKDSADYDIGDEVPFQLTATLPADEDKYAAYKAYKLVFHDTLSAGLDYMADSISIKMIVGEDETDVKSKFAIAENNGVLTISCDNVKASGFNAPAGAKIVVEYKAKLTGENVVFGKNGNPNKVHLEYSNKPDSTGTGEPGNTGETPDDTVIVFTYKVIANKINQAGEALPGAGFTLFKQVPPTTEGGEPTWKQIGNEVKSESMTTFSWKGIDDGIYKLVETTTPPNYNTMEDVVFEVEAAHTDGDTPALKSLSGDVESGEAEFSPSTDLSSLETEIVNKSGLVLPETGGIGTTLFYVFGAILVLGAAILLITRRRVNASK